MATKKFNQYDNFLFVVNNVNNVNNEVNDVNVKTEI